MCLCFLSFFFFFFLSLCNLELPLSSSASVSDPPIEVDGVTEGVKTGARLGTGAGSDTCDPILNMLESNPVGWWWLDIPATLKVNR